jgi:hypothetical protein
MVSNKWEDFKSKDDLMGNPQVYLQYHIWDYEAVG